MTDDLPALAEPAHLATRWERAVYWLDQATRVDEVVTIRNEAEQLKVAGRQARDRTLTANAVELQLRAERRLGEILIRAKEAGQLGRGAGFQARNLKRSEAEHLGGDHAGSVRVRLEEAGIDRKLSMTAQQLARSPAPLFEQMVGEARARIEAGRAIVVNPLKALNTAEKKLRRAIREAQLAARQQALPDQVYGVILADPEWRFETWSANGMDRAADNHYPTSELATIQARPVGTLAAPDCVLFLWATAPMLPQALEAMRCWGFSYVSQFVWDKLEAGTGYWARNRHELLLVGTRGQVPAPAPGTQWPSVIQSRPGAHSQKPDWAYELIEGYFPHLSKIELNARRRRANWSAWGYEAPEDNEIPAGSHGSDVRQPDTAAASATVSAERRHAAGPAEITGIRIPPASKPDAVASASGTDQPETLGTAYAALIAADTHRGAHTRETARPILDAAYGATPPVPVQQLADELGHKLMTVLSWARRCGLSSRARTSRAARDMQRARRATIIHEEVTP